MSFWNARFDASEDGKLLLPALTGRVGGSVALMPDGMIAIRPAKNRDGNAAADDFTGMAAVANRPGPFCK